MARGPSTFKQQDVTRALRAAAAAGVGVKRFEIDRDGKIVVVTSAVDSGALEQSETNEWDDE